MSRHDGSYDHDFIMNNPIPARCAGCGFEWVDGKLFRWTTHDGVRKEHLCLDAIRAPTLENCRCFWCGGKLVPLDQAAYAARLKTLPLYRRPQQPSLF